MEALKFNLSGRTAFFKKPEVNTYAYFTYGNVHKIALLGIFGAILGYEGYIQLGNRRDNPEFYKKLKNLRIAICPKSERRGSFASKIQTFNNSVGYASKEDGGNLIVKQQWLENPSWDIYVGKIESDGEAQKLADAMISRRCVYVPYLGSNAHPANISDVQFVKCEQAEELLGVTLEGLFPADMGELDIDADIDGGEDEKSFQYAESLPVALEEETNRYIMRKFIYSNLPVSVDGKGLMDKANAEVYSDQGRLITFF